MFLPPHCPLHSQPQQQPPEEPADLHGDGGGLACDSYGVEGWGELRAEVCDLGHGVEVVRTSDIISTGPPIKGSNPSKRKGSRIARAGANEADPWLSPAECVTAMEVLA